MTQPTLTVIEGNVENLETHTRELLRRYVTEDDTAALRELCDISARLSQHAPLQVVGDTQPARRKYFHHISALITQLKR